MADLLVELISNFINGSGATLNSLFNSMLNVVFYIERELSRVQLSNGNFLNFNAIYEVVYNYAIFILALVFVKKLISIYFLAQEGDKEHNPIYLGIGMVKAVIVMICAKEVYSLFVNITGEFLNSIINSVPVDFTDLAVLLGNNIEGGIFTAITCLVLVIVWLILICQFITKGIEMLILRIAIPFASIGLLNTDKGVFPMYIKKFLLNSFTLVVQLVLLHLSILIFANGHLIYGVAFAIMAVNTPNLLNEFMIKPQGNIINSAGNMARSVRALKFWK
ncbi:MAG: hypothetical protein HFJ34_06080 [Clostridia bacterium]|nr:hypothetical protein [Clostridia bacterium]